MRNSILFAVLIVGLSSGLAFASGGSPQSRPSGGGMSSKSPAEIATKKYNNGLKHLEKAKKLKAEIEREGDARKAAKLEKKLAKSYDKATKDFNAAVKANGMHFQAMASLGYILRTTGHHEEALVAYDKALSINPDYAPAIEYRAEAYLALDRLDDVKRAYLTLFAGDRKYADELQTAIDVWLVEHQDGSGELASGAVAEFGGWIEKRKELAARSTGGKSSGTW